MAQTPHDSQQNEDRKPYPRRKRENEAGIGKGSIRHAAND
jgi:hypothetical protein